MLVQVFRPRLLFATNCPFRTSTRILYQPRRLTRSFAQMATVESLNQEIAERTALFNDARKQGADAAIIEEHKQKLGELKRTLHQLQGASGSKDAGKKKERLLLKTAKVRLSSVMRLLNLTDLI